MAKKNAKPDIKALVLARMTRKLPKKALRRASPSSCGDGICASWRPAPAARRGRPRSNTDPTAWTLYMMVEAGRKVVNIRENPNVSVAVYGPYTGWLSVRGAQISGVAKLLTVSDGEEFVRAAAVFPWKKYVRDLGTREAPGQRPLPQDRGRRHRIRGHVAQARGLCRQSGVDSGLSPAYNAGILSGENAMKGFKAVGELAEVLESLEKAGSGSLEKAVEIHYPAVKEGHKVLAFGNGGSAAEAQHFAAELVNRFLTERKAIPAIALTTDTSALTAIANDRSFEKIFSRQIEAFGDKGDVAIALTTSGRSQNIIEGLKAAKAKGMATIALTGEGGGAVAGLPDILLYVPSKSTPRIQEAHLVLLHVIAEAVEASI